MKKKLNHLGFLLVLFVTMSFLTVSCGDKGGDDKGSNTPPAPTINTLSPDNGEEGTQITITGSRFGTDKSKVKVRFNTRDATNVVSVTDSEIKVVAPGGFSDQTVQVKVFVLDAASNGKAFYYNDVSVPVITSVTATSFAGATVTISGNGFSINKEENIVKFGDIVAEVTAATKTSLTVIAPDLGAATSANITVTKYGMTSNGKNITVDMDQNKVATHTWTTRQVKDGIIYKTGAMTLFGASTRRIHILDVTLNANNIMGIAHSTTGKYTTTLCADNNATVGVNAGYFGGESPKDPYIRINGAKVQDGHLGASPVFTNSALIIHNNVATVRKFTETHNNLNQVAAAIPVAQAQNIIVSGPMLVTNNVVEQQTSASHNTSSRARTALGVTEDGKRVFMVVVDEAGGSTGVQTPQMGKIMQALGSVNAMNFDGGGSSAMFVKNPDNNGLVNTPSDSPQRAIRNVIYVK